MPKRASSYSASHNVAKIGRRLAAIRELAGYNQESVCTVLAVDQSTYSKWEGGKRLPDVLALSEFAARFQVSLDFLYRGIPTHIHPELLLMLQEKHPELLEREPTDKVMGTDKAQAAYRAAIAQRRADQ